MDILDSLGRPIVPIREYPQGTLVGIHGEPVHAVIDLAFGPLGAPDGSPIRPVIADMTGAIRDVDGRPIVGVSFYVARPADGRPLLAVSSLVPNPFAAYAAYWDANALDSMFQDVAGTIPVTDPGDEVALLRDRSGHGIHFTQAAAAARPTLQVDGNGKNYLQFDGVDDFMTAGDQLDIGLNSFAVLAAVQQDNISEVQDFISKSRAGAGLGRWAMQHDNSNNASYLFVVNPTNLYGSSLVNADTSVAPKVLSGCYDRDGNQLLTRRNRSLTLTGGPVVEDSATSLSNAYHLLLGAYGGALGLGDVTAGAYLAGRIYAIVVLSMPLYDPDAVEVAEQAVADAAAVALP